jgi:hypothetical protein
MKIMWITRGHFEIVTCPSNSRLFNWFRPMVTSHWRRYRNWFSHAKITIEYFIYSRVFLTYDNEFNCGGKANLCFHPFNANLIYVENTRDLEIWKPSGQCQEASSGWTISLITNDYPSFFLYTKLKTTSHTCRTIPILRRIHILPLKSQGK